MFVLNCFVCKVNVIKKKRINFVSREPIQGTYGSLGRTLPIYFIKIFDNVYNIKFIEKGRGCPGEPTVPWKNR
jgi:hypothetical protein